VQISQRPIKRIASTSILEKKIPLISEILHFLLRIWKNMQRKAAKTPPVTIFIQMENFFFFTSGKPGCKIM